MAEVLTVLYEAHGESLSKSSLRGPRGGGLSNTKWASTPERTKSITMAKTILTVCIVLN